MSFPGQYADLALLLDKDAELDFFNNVAHLQLHRRQRALQRLTKVYPSSKHASVPLIFIMPTCLAYCLWQNLLL